MKLDFAAKLKAYLDGTNNIYNTINSFDNLSFDLKKSFIDESFYKTMQYCEQFIPYYKRVLNEYGYTSRHFTDINDVKKLPILTKEIIRQNYNDLRPYNISEIKYTSRRSGGTTGEPIRTLVSTEAAAFETFTYFKGLKWMGWNAEMTTVKLFGGSLGVGKRPTFRQRVYQLAMDSIFIPAFEIDNNNIDFYFNLMNKQNKICLIGYASAINNLVNLLREKNLKLSNVLLVLTTSEQLILDWKNNIETYFCSKVRSYYGCGEIESLGYQEYNGDESYKIPIENAFLESDSETNELLVTQLHNRAQPLIRFQNGDVGILNSELISDRIDKLEGRTADYFLRENGSRVSPIFGTHSILMSGVMVKQYQYVQYSDRVIEFRYLMETGNLSDNDKIKIEKVINHVMGGPQNIVYSSIKPFEMSPSGKHRITVCIDQHYYD